MASSKQPVYTVPNQHVCEGIAFPGAFTAASISAVNDFRFRDDDVIIASYPKTGTTWLQEIIYLLQHEADTELARSKELYERSPFLELAKPVSMLEYAGTLSGPRVFKSHLPPKLFTKPLESTQAKFVVVFRNVKDTVVSYYNFYKNNKILGNYTGSFDEFFEIFRERKLVFGDWFDFCHDWWSKRDIPNVYFVKFEDLKRDTKDEVRKLAAFLGTTATEAQLDAICSHVTFDAMKANPMVNREGSGIMTNFMRKGEVGDWTNWLSVEQNEYLDKLLVDRFRGTGLVIQDLVEHGSDKD